MIDWDLILKKLVAAGLLALLALLGYQRASAWYAGTDCGGDGAEADLGPDVESGIIITRSGEINGSFNGHDMELRMLKDRHYRAGDDVPMFWDLDRQRFEER